MTATKCFFATEIKTGISIASGRKHSHPCTEIVIYLQGFGKLADRHGESRYHPGMVAACPPGHEHRDQADSPGLQLCVGIAGCGAEQLSTPPVEADPSLLAAARLLRNELSSPPEFFRQQRLDLLAGLLALELGRLLRSAAPPAPEDRVRQLREILDSRFDENLNLSLLAADWQLTPDHLRYLFRRQTGESPLAYLIRRRLEAACELLNMTALPIAEVARRVGLNNAYYFSRLFRKHLGLSPSSYRLLSFPREKKVSKEKRGTFGGIPPRTPPGSP